MFDLRDFVMRTLRGMAETEPGYKVNQYALGWFDRQVLTADDLAVVDGLTCVTETAPIPEEPTGEPEGGSGTGEITEAPIEPTPEGETGAGEVVEGTPELEGETGTETTDSPAEEVTEPVVEPEGENV